MAFTTIGPIEILVIQEINSPRVELIVTKITLIMSKTHTSTYLSI
jgi:hypothetical protein